MRSIPQELFFAIVFGILMLVQFLYKQWRKRPEWMRAPGTLEDSAPPDPLHQEPVPVSAPVRPLPFARATERPTALGPALVRRTAHRGVWRPHRYSRSSLMPDRRAVQDAVVLVAILGPCNALRKQERE